MLTKADSSPSRNHRQEHPSLREPAAPVEAVEHPVDAAHREEEVDSVTVVDEEDLAEDAAEVDLVEAVAEVALAVVEEAEASRGVDPGEVVAEEASAGVDEDTRPWSWLVWVSKTVRGLREFP